MDFCEFFIFYWVNPEENMLWSTSRHNISIFSVLPLIVVISKFPRQIREKRNWRLNYLHQCWHSEGWVWLVLCLWHRRHSSWVQVQVPGTWWVVFLNVMNPCVIVSLVSELPNLSCGENIYLSSKHDVPTVKIGVRGWVLPDWKNFSWVNSELGGVYSHA